MGAAATAAGYLYASGRLRGAKAAREAGASHAAEASHERRRPPRYAQPSAEDRAWEPARPKPAAAPPRVEYRVSRLARSRRAG